MSTETLTRTKPKVDYPDSDGQPMADNTVQFRWIQTLQGGLDALFLADPLVFVAGDLLWYPVEGNNTLRAAPDVFVVWGRPKGDRGSYRQWEEDGLAPQVVFEIASPGNHAAEMVRKFRFYERYGVEEFYIYDPDVVRLTGWIRQADTFQEIAEPDGWTSPRLGVRFELSSGELRVLRPDGRPLASYVELAELSDRERQRNERLTAQLRALGVEPET
ncbi:MAG: Uma2 family endonuclease [Planctomycetota bacterium]|nr:Uma2 family endonuclease [Planctomycetota bacterium]